jgi:predicted GNAT family N-acyltransferase
MLEINIIKLNFNDKDFSIIKNIRKEVFSTELGISQSKLFDEYDELCDHFLMFDGKNIIGSVRFTKIDQKIKLERMAILKKYRRKNYGKNCILQLKEYYNTLGYAGMILDSIYSVKNFYKKCGFVEEGDIFRRVGIQHIRMSLTF